MWVVGSIRQETGPHPWKTCVVDVLEVMKPKELPWFSWEETGPHTWKTCVVDILEVRQRSFPGFPVFCLSTTLICSNRCDSISNRSSCVFCFRLIFFGGYGYFPEGKQRGTFEFDETSFWVSKPGSNFYLNFNI